MAEKQTAARPYAEAVFRLAQERGQLMAWSEMLALAAAVAADPRMQQLAFNPHIGRARLTQLFLEIGGVHFTAEAGNFIRLLVDNRRLTLLPEIMQLFELLKAEAEKRVDAVVTSAFALDDAQKNTIKQMLQRRLARDIHLTVQIDKTLMGGIVIRAGDLVIDGSVKGRLQELSSSLSH